jgi:hypothetical protein
MTRTRCPDTSVNTGRLRSTGWMRFCGSDDDVLVEGMGNRDYTAVSRQRRPKYLEWLRYVPGEVFHGVNVTANGAGRVVATEFVYHHLAEMGHGDLLVIQTLYRPQHYWGATPQRPPHNGLVQTGFTAAKLHRFEPQISMSALSPSHSFSPS